MAAPRSRILELLRAQCRIFSTTFNPEGIRTGNKVLRQRLRGAAVAAYYPRRVVTFKDLQKSYPEFEIFDDVQDDRIEHLQILKAKGKGAPKKKKSAEESKKFASKKKPAAAPKAVSF
ncbi:hypothetical protein L228DRAFT_269951 [Xylona heveae TC161]|uniref:Small ribosomal subunit protein mS33 n=1 Tax=Xylona heveae (strain CBS 132557 / TC161) TaxID=1328760 RepID=A0A165AKV9_XYLHT|nr:hypothetical protein L228DRAFT_269951 [Xylona heveae TC161]KZF20655.1 hypothetical protein L228DRAFT_269951 [Xylona heveae TC161]